MKKERCCDLVGRLCRLTREVTTGYGTYAVGSRWRIRATWRGKYELVGIDANGQDELNTGSGGRWTRVIGHLRRHSFELEAHP